MTIIIVQSKQSTSHLVLDHLQQSAACSDCHLSFVIEDIPVCSRRVFNDPPPQDAGQRQLILLRAVHVANRLPEVGSHMLSQLNLDLMRTVAFRSVLKMSVWQHALHT